MKGPTDDDTKTTDLTRVVRSPGSRASRTGPHTYSPGVRFEYELHLDPFEAETTRSYVWFDQFPSTFGAIVIALAPYGILPVAVLITLLLDITLSLRSPLWLAISALLFFQGLGIVLAAAPSEYNPMFVFGQAGWFNGRTWLYTSAVATGLSIGFAFLWVLLSIFFLTGYGVTSFPWLLV